MHRLPSSLAADGVAVLMISSDLPEILGMADRVPMMHEGRLTAEIPGAEATEESVMAAATGRTDRGRSRHDHDRRAGAARGGSRVRRARRLMDRIFKARELAVIACWW